MSELIEYVDNLVKETENRRMNYLDALDGALAEFSEKRSRSARKKVKRVLERGIKENYCLICNPIVAKGWTRCDREFFQDENNKKYLVVYSNYDTVRPIISVNQSLPGIIKLIESEPKCEGVVVNPVQKNSCFLKRKRLSKMMKVAEPYTEYDREEPTNCQDRTVQIIISPPVDVLTYENIAKDIRRLAGKAEDTYDILVDLDNDCPYSIHLSGGEKMHMEIISFSLPVFSNDGHVRAFRMYKDLEVENVVEAVKRICLYAEPADLNEYINLSFCGGFLDYDEGKDFMSLWRGIKEFEATLGSSKLKPEEE